MPFKPNYGQARAERQRNARARGRFLAKEPMTVAGLEAAEAVFSTLDSQQQIEAFVADGDEVEAGKVVARTTGFADVLLAGERLAWAIEDLLPAPFEFQRP